MSFIVLDKTFVTPLKEWMNAVGKPSNANALNRCIKDLIDSGIWNELDLFHLIGGLDSDNQRLRPLITTSTTKTFTAVASPTLAYNGVTGNGTSSYLNLNWIPSSQGVKYVLNSASYGIYSRTNNNDVSYDMGSNDGVPVRAIFQSRVAGNMAGYINNNSNITKANSDTLGIHCLQRTSSVLTTLYKKGVSLGTDTNASIGVPPVSFFLCARNANGAPLGFSTRNISMCFAGSGNIDQLKFHTIIQSYMTEVGLAV